MQNSVSRKKYSHNGRNLISICSFSSLLSNHADSRIYCRLREPAEFWAGAGGDHHGFLSGGWTKMLCPHRNDVSSLKKTNLEERRREFRKILTEQVLWLQFRNTPWQVTEPFCFYNLKISWQYKFCGYNLGISWQNRFCFYSLELSWQNRFCG